MWQVWAAPRRIGAVGLEEVLAAMDFVQIGGNVYCLAGATNIGVIVSPDGVAILVDSGLDSSVGRRAIREVTQRGWRVGAVVNTHAHADHVGGNAELKRRTGCTVWAPRFEEAWVREPLTEPLALFGGAYPPSGLLNKFTMAEPCEVDHIVDPGLAEICGIPLEIESLKGHSPNQIGILAGGVLFCGDAFFQMDQISKHIIPYNIDIASHLGTLRRILEITAETVVPGHGGVCESVRKSVEANVARITEIAERVMEAAGGGATSGAIVSRVASRMGVRPASVGHYYLIVSAINAYLSYLESTSRLRPAFDGGDLVWIPFKEGAE